MVSNVFYFHPETLGTRSNLTSIFFSSLVSFLVFRRAPQLPVPASRCIKWRVQSFGPVVSVCLIFIGLLRGGGSKGRGFPNIP